MTLNQFSQPVVLYGCVPSADGATLTISVTAGAVALNNTGAPVVAGSVTLDAADATYDRIDLVTVNSSGTIGKVTGTAQVGAVYPPSSTDCVIAQVYVGAGVTAITSDMGQDVRVLFPIPIDSGFFGTAVDGDLHIVSSTLTLADPIDQTGTRNLFTSGVLQRDAQFGTLTIDSGITVDLNGCMVQAQTILAAGATIKTKGVTATTFAGAVGIGGGLGGVLNGQAGTTGPTGNFNASISILVGGKGGAGGAGSSGAGGVYNLTINQGGVPSPWGIAYRQSSSGLPGCGGSGDNTNKGGGGASNTPALALIARVMDLSGATLTATGGNGAPGQGGNSGGGGGGGGGWILVYGIILGTPTYVVTGGTGGAGSGTGTAGANGSPGQHFTTNLL